MNAAPALSACCVLSIYAAALGQVCEPLPDGLACADVVCPEPADECQPSCVTFHPDLGVTFVQECACRPPGACYVDFPISACTAPDNGSGTADLPPLGCTYVSPGERWIIIDGLPPGTTIEMEGFLWGFDCDVSNPWCSAPLPLGECETPGGSLGGHVQCFYAGLELYMVGTGELTGYHRHILVPLFGETHSGPRSPGDAVQSFNTDMFRLQGEMFGDPDFCIFRVSAGSDYGLPGPGHTTLTELPGGDFAIDSFFDIIYQIEFAGCPGSFLEGLMGSTLESIRIHTAAAQPVCAGECPAGQPCEQTTAQNPDGSVDICCDCVVPECGPTPDGSDCWDVPCPEPSDDCQASCVNYDPVTGQSSVIDCECREPGACHVDLTPAGSAPCTVPDNGSGTADLPPDGCEYTSPDEAWMIIDGLPPGTTIEMAGIFEDFICQPSGQCSLAVPPGECEVAGGSLGGHGQCYEATLDLTVSGTGDLAGFNRHLAVPMFSETHSGPRTPGDPVQSFEADMFRLHGELFGDPDFCTLRITGGTDFGLPSPGATTLTELPGGDFAVDSFFDITYQIEFEGCPASQLEDYMGTTTATIRIHTGGTLPQCAGQCPPGQICWATMTPGPGGTLDLCCDCVAPTCEPTPDGSACLDYPCPDPGDDCQPACVNYDPNTGLRSVVDCECREPGTCHVDLVPPTAEPCTAVDNGNGTVDLPPMVCEYSSPDEYWMIIDGLPPGTTVEMEGLFMDFICLEEPSALCSLAVPSGECEVAGGSLGGHGQCYEATLDLTVAGTGELAGFTRHLAVPLFSETHSGPRNPGDPLQSFDTDMYRLTGELFGDPDFCTFRVTGGSDYGLPGPGHTTLGELPTGDFAVDSFFDITYQIEFEGCPASQLEDYAGTTTATIRIAVPTLEPPTCAGTCPPNTVCEQTETALPDGSVDICCDCVVPECGPTPDGSDCWDVPCPEPSDDCQASCVNYDPVTGESSVIDCECREPGACHVDLTPAGSAPCTVPDNGSGTADLPPEGCAYTSPDEAWMIIDGLPPGTTIEMAGIFEDFICPAQPSGQCSLPVPPGECEVEGGSLGGHGDCFESTLDLTVSGTGDLAGFNRHLAVPMFSETHSGPRNPGDPLQSFEADMFRLQGELFGDPDFCTLRITGGTDFGLPSPGHTTLTELPSGDFAVDSFFDITYQIEFEGCPASQLEDYMGTTTATIRVHTGGTVPQCAGQCPDGQICWATMTPGPGGTLDICCDCVDESCQHIGDCADVDADQLRDDNCMWWQCEDGECVSMDIVFADMGRANGGCVPDGAVAGNDRFHVLNCFSNQDTLGNPQSYPCELHPFYPGTCYHADAGGPFGECCPDGVCDAHDAFHVLNTFGGITPCACDADGGRSFMCPCPQPTAGRCSNDLTQDCTSDEDCPPVEPPGERECLLVYCPIGGSPPGPDLPALITRSAGPRTALRLQASRPGAGPGEMIEVDVLLATPVDDLRGYQLHLGVQGGDRGRLELLDVSIAPRKDHAYAGLSYWRAFNVPTAQMLAGLDVAGIEVPGGGYLATFTYRASKDALGVFTVHVLHGDRTARTFLFPTPAGGSIPITVAQPARITVMPRFGNTGSRANRRLRASPVELRP